MCNQTFQLFLKSFYQGSVGKELLEEEKSLLEQGLSCVFGYFLVQIGQTSENDLLVSSRINQKVIVDNFIPKPLNNEKNYEWVYADIDYLPFKPGSVDAVFLPHTLESVPDPYHLLRQVDKMIMADGRLIISGFNPWGNKIWKFSFGKYRKNFKQAHLISEKRLVDWLNLLGYELEFILYKTYHSYDSVWTMDFVKAGLQRLAHKLGLEFGNVYVIVAKKRVESPTPVGLNWRLANWLPIKRGKVLVSNQTNHKRKRK